MASGRETELNRRSDVIWSDGQTTAFVAPKWWDCSAAHVIVVPNDHFRDLYQIPEQTLGSVYATAKRIALALKDAYRCDGTSTRQHNEPAAGQEVWHFHVHVFPRYDGDRLYENDRRARWTSVEERAPYAERLREALG